MKEEIIAAVIVVVAAAVLEFLLTAGAVWLVCWAFGFAWSWKLCVGVWAACVILSLAVKSTGGRKE